MNFSTMYLKFQKVGIICKKQESQFSSLHKYIHADFSAQRQETPEQPSLPCEKPKVTAVNVTSKLT